MKHHTPWARASCAITITVIVSSPLFAQPTAAIKATIPINTQTPRIAPSPLLAVDQNRTTVVDRIVAQWSQPLQQSGAALSAEQLRTLLTGLRSDHLLAASLAGSLDGLRDVIAHAVTATADVKANLLHTKALGDTSDDLTYTPVTPCRLADTRVAGGALGANSTRDFKVWVSSGGFTAQGGDSGNCGVPADPAAVVLNIAVVNMASFGNLIAYPTGGALPNTSVLNYQGGTFALSNGAIIPACVPGCANQLTVRTNGAGADVVIDVVGYFKAPGAPIGTVSNVATGVGLTGGPITTTGTIGLATTQLLPTVACTSNQVPQWNGSAWTCATVGGGGGGGTVTSVGTGTGLTGGPITTSGTINLTSTQLLPNSACGTNQIPKWNGSAWTCGADNNSGGTVTSITAGGGLTGGTITTSGTIAIDPNSGTLTSNFFVQGGNAFADSVTVPSLGTTNNHPLELIANNTPVMRYDPITPSPNIIGGFVNNGVYAGVYGTTIAGGGAPGIGYAGFPCSYAFGCQNSATDHFGTIGGGLGNLVGNTDGDLTNAMFATVAGGLSNAAAFAGAVGGGKGNQATGDFSTVAGGENNTASGDDSTVPGGKGNSAVGFESFAAGAHNSAGGSSSFAAGTSNSAGGDNSFAVGFGAIIPASAPGTFLWSDHQAGTTLPAGAHDEFIVVATNGIGLYTSHDFTGGCVILSGGNLTCNGAITPGSDRNAKTAFASIDPRALLAKVVQLPISSWVFKTDPAGTRHIGPMAQDFVAAFEVGADDKHIATVDANGVALAAIQGLNMKLKEQASTIGEQQREIADLRERVSAAENLRGELAALRSALAEVLQERRTTAWRD